jgi:hypothetical protein
VETKIIDKQQIRFKSYPHDPYSDQDVIGLFLLGIAIGAILMGLICLAIVHFRNK